MNAAAWLAVGLSIGGVLGTLCTCLVVMAGRSGALDDEEDDVEQELGK